MTNKLKGFEKSKDYGRIIKAMAGANGYDVLRDVKMPRKRRAEVGPRKAYDRAEDRLRPLIINALRRRGFSVWRVEPYGRGSFGLADLWIAHRSGRWVGWAEIKTSKGCQSKEQVEFQDLCALGDVKYIVLKSVEEASRI